MSNKNITEFNKVVKKAKLDEIKGLLFPSIEKGSLTLNVYADTDFSCNDDLSSQISFIILLCD